MTKLTDTQRRFLSYIDRQDERALSKENPGTRTKTLTMLRIRGFIVVDVCADTNRMITAQGRAALRAAQLIMEDSRENT